MIGLVVLGVALAEGAATDWLPILMFDDYGVSASTASIFYMVFAIAVTVGRLAGGPVLARLGRRVVVQGGMGLAAVGMVIVIWGTAPWMALIGVTAWGLGSGGFHGLPHGDLGGCRWRGGCRAKS